MTYTLAYSLAIPAIPYEKADGRRVMAAIASIGKNSELFKESYPDGYLQVISDPDFSPSHLFKMVRLDTGNAFHWGDDLFITDQDGFLYSPVGAVRFKERTKTEWYKDEHGSDTHREIHKEQIQVYGAVGNLRNNLAKLHQKYATQIDKLNNTLPGYAKHGRGKTDLSTFRIRLFKQREGHIDHIEALVKAADTAGCNVVFPDVSSENGAIGVAHEIKFTFPRLVPTDSSLVSVFQDIEQFTQRMKAYIKS